MQYRPVRCLLPKILKDKKIDPVDFYTRQGWKKQQYSAYTTLKHIMSLQTAVNVGHDLGLPAEELYEWIPSDGADHKSE